MPSYSSIATRPLSTNSPHPPPPSAFFDRFRYTIGIYKHVAAETRSSLQLTFHARRKAASLGLRVDTQKAVRCDQRQVSNIPLPILDTEPSPVKIEWVHEDIHTVLQSMPQSVSPTSSSSSSSFTEDEDEDMRIQTDVDRRIHAEAASQIQRPLHRPALRCIIPGSADVVEEPRSKFSPESEYSAVTLTSAKPPSPGSTQADNEVMLHYPYPSSCVADVFNAEGQPVTYDQEMGNHIMNPAPRRLLQPLEVPLDATRLSWGCGEINEMDVSSTSSTFTEYTGSEASTSGLNTPEDGSSGHQGSLMIRIKRSHSSMSMRAMGSADESDMKSGFTIEVEKRPKVERKEWAHPYARRSLNLLRISPARRQS